MHERGNLDHIRRNRSPDPCFHSNLDKINTWLKPLNDDISPRRYHLHFEVKRMLSKDPKQRPSMADLLSRTVAADISRCKPPTPSIFNACCRKQYIDREEHEVEISQLKSIHVAQVDDERRKTGQKWKEYTDSLEEKHAGAVYSLQATHREIIKQLHQQTERMTLEHNEAGRLAAERTIKLQGALKEEQAGSQAFFVRL
jgi:serine/threonine protein kinase